MTLTQIKPLGLNKPVDLADNEKIRLGTSQDLQIYHDGSHSYLADTGTGDLTLTASKTVIGSSNNSEVCASFTENGAVELYYDNSKKFETTQYGVNCTASLDVQGSTTLQNTFLSDSDVLNFGTGNDLQIHHDGTNSFLVNTTGDLLIRNTTGNEIKIQAVSGEQSIQCIGDAAVELYYDNVRKFRTHANGTVFEGNLNGGDNAKLTLGNGDDLQIYHDGTNSRIEDQGTGYLAIRSNNIRFENPAANEALLYITENGAVELYHDNAKKFETTTNGAQITGRLDLVGGYLSVDDNYSVVMGTDGDAQLYHSGTHQYLLNTTGNIYLMPKSGEYSIGCYPNAQVELYYDNVKKLETHSNGCIFTGSLYGLDNNKIELGNSNDLKIFHDGSNSKIQNTQTGRLHIENSAGLIRTNTDSGFYIQSADGNTTHAEIDSDGLKFNGDTAAANAIEDYEEGTWTPTFVPHLGSYTSISYNSQDGRYVKVGRLVNIWFRIDVSAINTSGASSYLRLLGLPFQAASGHGFDGGTLNVNYYHSIANMGDQTPTGYVANGQSLIVMGRNGGNAWVNMAATDLGTTNFYAHMSYYS